MAFIKINKQNFFHNLSQFTLKTGSKESIAIVLKERQRLWAWTRTYGKTLTRVWLDSSCGTKLH